MQSPSKLDPLIPIKLRMIQKQHSFDNAYSNNQQRKQFQKDNNILFAKSQSELTIQNPLNETNEIGDVKVTHQSTVQMVKILPTFNKLKQDINHKSLTWHNESYGKSLVETYGKSPIETESIAIEGVPTKSLQIYSSISLRKRQLGNIRQVNGNIQVEDNIKSDSSESESFNEEQLDDSYRSSQDQIDDSECINSDCLICYMEFTDKIVLEQCKHGYCMECLEGFLTFQIKSNHANHIKCPQHDCPKNLIQEEIKRIVNDETFKLYQSIKKDKEIVKNKNVMYCPMADCGNVIDIKKSKREIKCNKCSKSFCKNCKAIYHGKSKCTEIIDLSQVNGLQISNCPKCQALVEKQSGCQHMTCSVCKYEWCWLCGLPYNNIFHYAQMGGLLCELTAGSFFKRKPCCTYILIALMLIFFPLIVWFFSCFFVGGGLFFLAEYIYKHTRLGKWLQGMKNQPICCNCCKNKCCGCLWAFTKFMFLANIFLIDLGLALGVGSAIAGVMVFPAYVIFLVVLIRLSIRWSKFADKDQQLQKQKQRQITIEGKAQKVIIEKPKENELIIDLEQNIQQ
eukprot:403368354